MSKNKNLISGGIIVCLLIILGAWYVVSSRAATSNIVSTNGPAFGIYTNPISADMTVGSKITVNVMANLGSSSVQTISSYLHYDPTLLRLDSASQTGVSSDYSIASRCSSLDGCKTAGNVVFVVGKSGQNLIASANGILLGALTFTALKTGTANLTLDADPQLTGFTSSNIAPNVLNQRVITNGTYNIGRSKGKKR